MTHFSLPKLLIKGNNRFKLLSTAAITILPASHSDATSPLPFNDIIDTRPNIIVILSDDIGFSDLGCFGSEIRTPNLDALAAKGVRFTQFYNTSRSSPSRASLLTGLYAHQAGMGHLSSDNYSQEGYVDDLNRNIPTIAEILKGEGYSTYMAGKWHLARNMGTGADKSDWPVQRGFERFFGTLAGSGSYYDPGTLMSGNEFIAPVEGFYYTDAISDTTVKFIREHSVGKPFFIYVAYTAAHWPLHAPEEEIRAYEGVYDCGWDTIRARRYRKLLSEGIIGSRCFLTERSVKIPAWEDEPLKQWQSSRMQTYAAMVTVMDKGIGRIIKTLREKGLLENTVIMYMQDNGGCAEPVGTDKPQIPLTDEQKKLKPTPYSEINLNKKPEYTREGYYVRGGRGVTPGKADSWVAYGEEWANVSNTPFRSYKQYVHEGGIASPLIVSWPGGKIKEGLITRQLSHLIDILPTCLEVAGNSYPDSFNNKAIARPEGMSLVSAMKGYVSEQRTIFFEHSGNRALRIGDWKIVSKVKTQKKFSPSDENKWELYNLYDDPAETNNLAQSMPEKTREMAEIWEKEALRVKAKPWPWDTGK